MSGRELRQLVAIGCWLSFSLLLSGQLLGKEPRQDSMTARQHSNATHAPNSHGPVVRFVSDRETIHQHRSLPAPVERTPVVSWEYIQPSPNDVMLDVAKLAQLPTAANPPRPAKAMPTIAAPEDRAVEVSLPDQPAEVGGTAAMPSNGFWLDVRPRSVEDRRLISQSALPADVSGQQDRSNAFHRAVDRPPADLRLSHFCEASTFYHRPLYFEDPALERCGCPAGLFGKHPSVRSGAHFFLSAATLPLAMRHQKPCSCVKSGCLCQHCE